MKTFRIKPENKEPAISRTSKHDLREFEQDYLRDYYREHAERELQEAFLSGEFDRTPSNYYD